jgi:hypothetical protein
VAGYCYRALTGLSGVTWQYVGSTLPVWDFNTHPSVYTTFRWPLALDLLNSHLQRLRQNGHWLIRHAYTLSTSQSTSQSTHEAGHNAVEQAMAIVDTFNPSSLLPALLQQQHANWRCRLSLSAQTPVNGAPLTSHADPQPLITLHVVLTPLSGLTSSRSVALAGSARPYATVKHGDCAPYWQYRHRVNQDFGAQEALLTHPCGWLSEGAFSAIAVWVNEGHQQGWAFPHPALHGCLPSVTVQWFQQWLSRHGGAWWWQAFTPSQLRRHAKGLVYLTAVQGVVTVTYVGNWPVPWDPQGLAWVAQANNAYFCQYH